MYNHYNICNIPIYFCNINLKHLQHTSEISETLETDSCSMRFQRSGAEVVDVELVGGTDLDRGYCRRMERGRNGTCESVRGHVG